MLLVQLQAARPAPGCRAPGARPKPPTTPACRPAGAPSPRPGRRQLRCTAQAATATPQQLEGWLAAAGVDVGKLAAAPGASGGLVATRAVKAGEQLLAIPQSAWITAETALQSDIGKHLAG